MSIKEPVQPRVRRTRNVVAVPTIKPEDANLSVEQKLVLDRLQKDRGLLQQLVGMLVPVAAAAQAQQKIEPEPAPSVEPKPAPSKPRTLKEKIQETLTQESMDLMQLARALHVEDRGKVQRCLDDLRDEGSVYNVGYEDSPVYTWRIGPETDGLVLRQTIARLISERPMYLQDLVRATGAKPEAVSIKMVDIQRHPPEGLHVVDMSPKKGYKPHGRAKMYFLADLELRDASLQPQSVTRKAKQKP